MDINQLRYAIESSFVTCAQCPSVIDSWPAADPGEAGDHKVIYSARDGLFVGMCENAHVNEFYLGELKAGEVVIHDVTERTLGRLVKQVDCKHSKTVKFDIEPGMTIMTSSGPVEGPASAKVCALCHARFDVKKGEKKAAKRAWGGIVGIDGRPIGGRSDDSN